jgi:K+-sensing histidine kinase KdpD
MRFGKHTANFTHDMNTEIQPPKKIADLATFLPAPEIKRLLTQKEMAALKAADDAWKSLNERLAKVSHDVMTPSGAVCGPLGTS